MRFCFRSWFAFRTPKWIKQISDKKYRDNEEALNRAADLNPETTKLFCPDRKQRMAARCLLLQRRCFEEWLPRRTLGDDECCWYPEGELLEDRTLGDEWGFKLKGDKRLQWKRIRSNFCPAFISDVIATPTPMGGMDAAPASIASSTESTKQQNRFL